MALGLRLALNLLGKAVAIVAPAPPSGEALLRANGFERMYEYGDWDKTPLAIDSPSIISVSRKA